MGDFFPLCFSRKAMFGELPLLCFYFLNLELLIAYTVKLKEVQDILYFRQDLTSSIQNGILKQSQILSDSVGILFSYEEQNVSMCKYPSIQYIHIYICMYIYSLYSKYIYNPYESPF